MLLAILRHEADGKDAWFDPAESRFDFAWLG